MRTDVTKEAIGRWPSILAAIGVPEEFLRNKHGPCVICGGKDRYRFDDKDGKGTFFCSRCGSGDGFKLIEMLRNVDFKAAAQLVRDVLPSSTVTKVKEKRDNTDRLQAIWNASSAMTRDDPVDSYLRARGIEIKEHPRAMRCGRVDYWNGIEKVGTFDAMVARVTDAGGKPVALHITYLDGAKKANVPSPKKVLGSLPPGSAIRLAKPGGFLAVAEGIETALAFGNCWACISGGGMRKWSPPAGVTMVVVAGDNDENFVGQAAAFELAKRLHAQGIKVDVRIPDVVGMDWADQLMKE